MLYKISSLRYSLIFSVFLIVNILYPQKSNVELEGPVTIGNTINATPAYGTIKWTGSDFEGFTPEGWVSLTKGFKYVQDVDNNSYRVVKIGKDYWMAENLRTTRFNDESEIPFVIATAAWQDSAQNQSPAYTWYNNESTPYGALYNWYTIDPNSNGNKNICPSGWHVPSNLEWISLVNSLGGTNVAGGKMKETGLLHWNQPNKATNESGLTLLAGGFRNAGGTFLLIGDRSYYWSSTASSSSESWHRQILNNGVVANNFQASKGSGMSIRCKKD